MARSTPYMWTAHASQPVAQAAASKDLMLLPVSQPAAENGTHEEMLPDEASECDSDPAALVEDTLLDELFFRPKRLQQV